MQENLISRNEKLGSIVFFGSTPVDIECPYCHNRGYTIVEFESVICLCIFVMACFAFILCCIQGLKKPVHYCARCHQVLGCGQDPICG